MKQFNSQILINNILSKASHNRFKQLSNIFYGMPTYLYDNLQFKDQAYLEAFQYSVLCQYVTHPNFRPKVNQYRSLLMDKQILTSNDFKQKKQVKKTTSSIQRRLLNAIKMLGQNKDTYFAYIQAQEIIVMMSAQQAQKNKKYLIYIYKWVTNQKQWYNSEIKNLGIELKKTVVNKINEGTQKLEQQIKLQKQLEALQQKIKNDIEAETKRQAEKVQQVIATYKDKNQANTVVADKSKQ